MARGGNLHNATANPLFGTRILGDQKDKFFVDREEHYVKSAKDLSRTFGVVLKQKEHQLEQLWREFLQEVHDKEMDSKSQHRIKNAIKSFVDAFYSLSHDYSVIEKPDMDEVAQEIFSNMNPKYNQRFIMLEAISNVMATKALEDVEAFKDSVFDSRSVDYYEAPRQTYRKRDPEYITLENQVRGKVISLASRQQQQVLLDKYIFNTARLMPSIRTKGDRSLLEQIDALWRETGLLPKDTFIAETPPGDQYDEPGVVHVLHGSKSPLCLVGEKHELKLKPSRAGRWNEALEEKIVFPGEPMTGHTYLVACEDCRLALKRFPGKDTFYSKTAGVHKNWTPLTPAEEALVMAPIKKAVLGAVARPNNPKRLRSREVALCQARKQLTKAFWSRIEALEPVEAWMALTGLSREQVESSKNGLSSPPQELQKTKIRFSSENMTERLRKVSLATINA